MKKVTAVILACLTALSAFGFCAFAEGYTKTYTVTLDNDASSLLEFVSIDPAELEGKITGDPSSYATSRYVAEKIPAASAKGDLSAYNYTVIAVRGKGSKAPDQTSTIKVYPATVNVDIVTDKDFGNDTLEYDEAHDRLPKELRNAFPTTEAFKKQNYGAPVILVGNKSNSPSGKDVSIPADCEILKDKDGDYINEHGEKINKVLIDEETNRYKEREYESYASEVIYIYRFYNVTEDIVVRGYNISDKSLGSAKNFVMNLLDFFRQIIRWFFGLF